MSLMMLLAAVLCILVAGFFNGAETGSYVLNRIRLRLRAESGRHDARRLLRLLDDHRGLVTTTLVGNNLAEFGASLLVTHLIARLAPERVELITTVIVAPLLFIFANLVPKALFGRHADVLMYQVTEVLQGARFVLRPLVAPLAWLTALWEMVARREDRIIDPLHSRDRLFSLLMTGTEEGVLSPYQQDVAANILQLGTIRVERVMVPMARAGTVPAPVEPEKVLQALGRASHARYPVIGATGAVESILDVTRYLLAWRTGAATDDAFRPVLSLAPDTPVPRALEILQSSRDPVGIVVDRTGRPIGLVTMKDLVEEIVGELGEW